MAVEELEGMVRERMTNPDKPIFEDREVTLFTGQRYVAIRKLRRGTLRIYVDDLSSSVETVKKQSSSCHA